MLDDPDQDLPPLQDQTDMRRRQSASPYRQKYPHSELEKTVTTDPGLEIDLDHPPEENIQDNITCPNVLHIDRKK